MDRLRRIKGIGFALEVNTRYGDDGGNQLAAAMTYFGFLSLFPLILLVLSAAGFLLANDPDAQAEVASRAAGAVPGIGPLIGENIDALVNSRSGAGIAGLVGLVLSGTGLTNSAGYALGRIYRRPLAEGLVGQRLWALGSTGALGLLALAGVAASGIVGGTGATGALGAGLAVAAFLVSAALDVVLFLFAYRLLAAGSGPAFSLLWPGAVLAGAGWTALKVAGTWYATRTVANASEVYGTFGSVIGILAILYLASRLFLYGAELNALLVEKRATAPTAPV